MLSIIRKELEDSKKTLENLISDEVLLNKILEVSELCVEAIKNGKKIIFAGNGGSAADSQHLAAELVSRLKFNRGPLAGLALTTDTSALTAIGNDYGFDFVFARQLGALGQEGDVYIAISTSGNSANILESLKIAQQKKIYSVGFTGQSGGKMHSGCDYLINVPSSETAKIQECHIKIGHIICQLIESALFKNDSVEAA